MKRYIAYIGLLLCLCLNACSFQTKPVMSNADRINIGYYAHYGDRDFDFYIFHNDSTLREFAKDLKLFYKLILIDTATFKSIQQYLSDNQVYKLIKDAPSEKELLTVRVDTQSISKIETKQYILDYVRKLRKYFETIENEHDRKQLTEMCDYIYKGSENW